jgi:hypothetical protein
MATRPKSISIKDLSGAVHSALGKLKVKPLPEEGPWLIINPGIICGLIFVGPNVEAEALASSIAKEVSANAGVTLTPVVQEAGAVGQALALVPHRPVILGYKHELQVHF